MKSIAIVRVLALLLVMFVANPQQQLVVGNPELEEIERMGDEAILKATGSITPEHKGILMSLTQSVVSKVTLGETLVMDTMIPAHELRTSLAAVVKGTISSRVPAPIDRRSFAHGVINQIIQPCSKVNEHLKLWHDRVIEQAYTPDHQINWRILESLCSYLIGTEPEERRLLINSVYTIYVESVNYEQSKNAASSSNHPSNQ